MVACGDNATTPDAKVVDTGPGACGPPSTAAYQIFLNRAGGAYVVGSPDDSRTNTTAIITQDTMLAPATVMDADWSAVLACVTQKLEPFDVAVTDVDPGTADHAEIVMIDNINEIGLPGSAVVASPFSCAGSVGAFDRNAISFVVWTFGGGSGANDDRCWLIAQALGTGMGLDFVMSCADVMSDCAASSKTFTNSEAMCGLFSARDCLCGGTTQNSFESLAARVGVKCR